TAGRSPTEADVSGVERARTQPRRWRRGRWSPTEEDAAEDGVGAGDSNHRDGDGAAGGDVDREGDPGALREVGADVGALWAGAVVDRDGLPPAGAFPVQCIDVKTACVSTRAAEVESELVGVVPRGGVSGRCIGALQDLEPVGPGDPLEPSRLVHDQAAFR